MFANRKRQANQDPTRRGAAGVFAAVALVMLMGMAALSVDVGMLYVGRSELQRAADAAALAGAWELLDQGRLQGSPNSADEIGAARRAAAQYAAANAVLSEAPTVDQNDGNAITGDVVIGFLDDPNDKSKPLLFSDPNAFNTVQVTVRRDEIRNGPVQLLFARVIGFTATNVSAQATATFKDGVIGYAIPAGSSATANMLPFALDLVAWTELIGNVNTTGDNYAYDDASGSVYEGTDNINELNLYPGAGPTQLPPGNFGTIDVGSESNSTADLARQIVYGINADDLAFHGGELTLDANGYIYLNGDTGISAGMKDELESIIGLPRSLPLFDQVSGPGDNATFRIVGFAGIRILNVRLTGSMNHKQLIIQPSFVVDETAVTGPSSETGSSYYVYEPVRLVR